ncbi:putative glycolipid-binding domain-containing protein [Phytoactinopolyspora alkaliphila]|uniref:putative glycolipid-binding domain-containing protein n=1 Tax=Phytoactinopolyspora alkaliphila TaxID=1783498 RepID=UPI0031B5D7E1
MIVWTPNRWAGGELVQVRSVAGGIRADGMVIATEDGIPARLHYQIACDDAWHTRHVSLNLHGHPLMTLTSDDDRRWYLDSDPESEMSELAGCIDVDIALTPFTNTLPIRRLRLQPGESASPRAVYIQPGAELDISTLDQRYTRTDTPDRAANTHESGAAYRYESGSFRTDLQVDQDGIVIDYPGLWTRHRNK